MSGKKILGLLALGAGAVLLAPKESLMILNAVAQVANQKAPQAPKSEQKFIHPVAELPKVGVIRKAGKKIVSSSKRFWKWLY